MTSPQVAILLGLYNGARFLPEQLESFRAQTHRDWSLLVSDDGSSDEGPAIVRRFAAENPGRDVALVPGPRRGFARNFLGLMRAARGRAPFAALSDQDDVWLPGKLERALDRLREGADDRPALYCARTLICDETLRVLGASREWRRPPGFGHALVQNLGGGNTMVMNAATLDLVARAVTDATEVVAHDWFLYQIVTGAGGRVVFDPEPVLLYRQHGGNQIGANLSWAARARRFRTLMGGEFRAWNRKNIAALQAARPLLTPEAQETLLRYDEARAGPLPSRLRNLRASRVRRQDRLETLALYLSSVMRGL